MALELVAIHIKKTAGQSFKRILRRGFGRARFYRLNIPPETPLPERQAMVRAIPPDAACLHGHFLFRDVAELVSETNARVIAWVRDPVERVISSYYFLLHKFHMGVRPDYAYLNGMSVLDFARRDENRDEMARALEGIELKELLFLGIFEHFDEDSLDFAKLMRWPRLRLYHSNASPALRKDHEPLAEADKVEIRRLNEQDEALYRRALELRAPRRAHVESLRAETKLIGNPKP